MTTETTATPIDVTVETVADTTAIDTTDDKTVLEKQLADTKAELSKNADLLAKVRKFEKENKEAADKALKEQGKFKELYEEEMLKRQTVEGKFKDKMVTEALTEQLKDANAKSISTVMKLVDKSKVVIGEDLQVDLSTVKLVIAELVKSDPVLFGVDATDPTVTDKKKETVDVKRVADTDTIGSYEKEMRAAKTIKEIEAVMQKYGKKH